MSRTERRSPQNDDGIQSRSSIAKKMVSITDPESVSFFVQSKIQLAFILINNSLVPVPHFNQDPSDVPKISTLALSLLSIITLISMISNLSLVATVLRSHSLKEIPLCNILSYLSTNCFFDSSINAIYSILYMAYGTWTFSSQICSLNSFFMLFISSSITNAVMTLILERCYVVCFPISHTKNKKKLLLFLRVYFLVSWIALAAFIAPAAIDTIIQSLAFRQRYSCGPNMKFTANYSLFLLILSPNSQCLLITICIPIICWNLCRYWQQDKINQRRGRDKTSTPPSAEAAYVWEERRDILIALLLVCIYAILLFPHMNAVNAFQLKVDHSNSADYESLINSLNSSFSKEQRAAIQNYDKQLRLIYDSYIKNITSFTVTEIDESPVQNVFIWCRYIFDALIPILILLLQVNIKNKSYEYACCSSDKYQDRFGSGIAKERVKRSKPYSSPIITRKRSQNTPTLVPTSNGLYMRLVDQTNLPMGGIKTGEEATFEYVFFFCDLISKEKPVAKSELEKLAVQPIPQSIPAAVKKKVTFNPILSLIEPAQWVLMDGTFVIDETKEMNNKESVPVPSAKGLVPQDSIAIKALPTVPISEKFKPNKVSPMKQTAEPLIVLPPKKAAPSSTKTASSPQKAAPSPKKAAPTTKQANQDARNLLFKDKSSDIPNTRPNVQIKKKETIFKMKRTGIKTKVKNKLKDSLHDNPYNSTIVGLSKRKIRTPPYVRRPSNRPHIGEARWK